MSPPGGDSGHRGWRGHRGDIAGTLPHLLSCAVPGGVTVPPVATGATTGPPRGGGLYLAVAGPIGCRGHGGDSGTPRRWPGGGPGARHGAVAPGGPREAAQESRGALLRGGDPGRAQQGETLLPRQGGASGHGGRHQKPVQQKPGALSEGRGCAAVAARGHHGHTLLPGPGGADQLGDGVPDGVRRPPADLPAVLLPGPVPLRSPLRLHSEPAPRGAPGVLLSLVPLRQAAAGDAVRAPLLARHHAPAQHLQAYGDDQVKLALAVFLFCQLGNFSIHVALRNLRPAGSKARKIPYPTRNPFTWLFLLVSCPNYTYEVGSWIGFTIMTQCLPVALFSLVGFVQMAIWAQGKHRSYLREFRDYPPLRSPIVPFLL
uniref:Trans-2,3-enoyl-CoA reductase n=1 Tax=Taeniopygia guttata TaxID=59729 RepID=A0A674H8G3_TAEGU